MIHPDSLYNLHAALDCYLRQIAPGLKLRPGVTITLRELLLDFEVARLNLRDGRVPFAQSLAVRTDYPVSVSLRHFNVEGIVATIRQSYPVEADDLVEPQGPGSKRAGKPM